MELQGDAGAGSLILVNKNPTPAADPSNFSWLTAGQGRGWNAVQNRLVGTPPANDFAFLYKTVPNDADPDAIIYFNIAAPRDPSFSGASVAFVSIRGYFVSSVAAPGPPFYDFTIEGAAGSSDLHMIPGTVGCFPNDTNIDGSILPPLWEQQTPVTSSLVNGKDRVYILDFPYIITAPTGNLADFNGLFLFKMTPLSGFNAGAPAPAGFWDPDGANEIQFLGISYDWRFA